MVGNDNMKSTYTLQSYADIQLEIHSSSPHVAVEHLLLLDDMTY